MAGNDPKRPGQRKSNKKGATKGSGGQRRRSLQGKGPTPKAEDREYHKAYKRKVARERSNSGRHERVMPDVVVGRNPVVECLRAKAPGEHLYVAQGTRNDDRLTEAVNLAHAQGIPITECMRYELDLLANTPMNQGIGLVVSPFQYDDIFELTERALAERDDPVLVLLDNITDPRNLGAVIRSTAAFGGHGVIIPERRSAAVTAVAWRTSAGTAARLPVAKVTNITRTLRDLQEKGFQVVGLAGDGTDTLDTYEADGPTVIVVGSEGKGISRLVRSTCDSIISIPTTDWVESLNASVAAGVVLAEFARQRRQR